MAANGAAKKPVPPALVAHQFRPGQSGNPKGLHAAPNYLECLRLCREASPKAIQRLIELMDSDDARVASVACNSILDRAWGKTKEMDLPKDELDPAVAERRRQAREQMLVVLKACEEGKFREPSEQEPAKVTPATGPRERPIQPRSRVPVHEETSPPAPESWPN